MTQYVASIASVSQSLETNVPVGSLASVPTLAKNDNHDASRFRLTIEAVGDNRFVYKVRDRVTGEVIRQLPREDVEKLNSDPTYRGGRLVNTVV